jgi:hypothetical protein
MTEKFENFAIIAEKRVNKAITSIRSIGKMTNKSRYDYTEKDVRKIYSVLKKEIDLMRDTLEGKKQGVEEFKLR